MEGNVRGPDGAVLVGVVLGVLGAALDFYSAYRLAAPEISTMGGMPAYSSSGTAWGVGLAALGVLLLVTAAAGASSLGEGRMGLFGGLMVAFGSIMLLVGAAMGLGVSPSMQTAAFAGLGMLAVGVLMVANGSVMLRAEGRGMPRP